MKPSPRIPPGLKPAAFTLCRLAAGAILFYASLDKLGGAEKFSKMVENYHILPAALIPLAAVVIPWLEFFTGICLALGFKRRGAALLFSLLMAVYSVALAVNLAQGVDMNCGCFSMDSAEKLSGLTVARDLGFLALGLAALFAPRTWAELDSLIQKP
ncbi:MAG TPA: MauE/DoxX family redox-associated membrane protein [bacterium]|nr:MauE/DoxX family redox-associated membrane protein [bacterium]